MYAEERQQAIAASVARRGRLSVAEIAERLGITTKAAESTLTRARNAFRDAFAEVNS